MKAWLGVVLSCVCACGTPSESTQAPQNAPPPLPAKPPAQQVTPTRPTLEPRTAAAARANDAALSMFRALPAVGPNPVLAPASIFGALHMTLLGARAETAKEMQESLGLHEGDEAWFAAAMDDLTQVGHGPELTYGSASRLYPAVGLAIRPEYLASAMDRYHAQPQSLDFAQTEAARHTINQWVSEQTHERIAELLPKGAIDASTSLVLTNAVYLLAQWKDRFDERATFEDTFHARGRKVRVPFMHKRAPVSVATLDGARLLELPYRGDRLVFDVILPDPDRSLGKTLSSINAARLDVAFRELTVRTMSVALPKFRVAGATLNLVKPLRALGMQQVFSPRADLSGLAGAPRELFVSGVLHQVFVEVDEKGTEAAAATAVVMNRSGLASDSFFLADRPFLFLIRDRVSGLVLFVGALGDPGAQG